MDPIRFFALYFAISLLAFYLFLKKKVDRETELYPSGVRWLTYALLIPVSFPAMLAVLVAATIDGTKAYWKQEKSRKIK